MFLKRSLDRKLRSDPPEVVFEVVLKTGEPDFGWALFGVEGLNRIGR
jgi:hypothetical protein